MNLERRAGVQLHPTSLPGRRLGRPAYAWVDWLAEAGQSWWQMLPLSPPDRYGSPYKARSAFAASPALLAEPSAPVGKDEELDFREREAAWIEDWARFAGRDAVADQVRFDREWRALRAYAAERGVRIIGDVPIYVAPGSVDHRAHPEFFRDDAVAGTPPDAFTDKGQLWGNPLYDWPALRRRRYRWWIARLARTFALFDLARIDHFRGFCAYWAVPKGARNARGGRWQRGPGRALFDAAAAVLGELPVIAEDLGVITPPVDRLRDGLGFPGIVVLQFGFTPDDQRNTHDVGNHREHSVAYTGTHDNDTVRGWYETLPDDRRALVDAARPGEHDEVWWDLIALSASSRARVAMVQAQDVLGLGSEARMNLPGTAAGSWRWAMDEVPGADLAARLREVTEAAGRLA
ncbi:MAG TPA: 4-alpha-glucanotransferase [Solirubrobacteraceae bacterium]|nr:4-alpha-glucanotransferase [Solirubrobacteraceae bacterium]